jgi:hypothetical protein
MAAAAAVVAIWLATPAAAETGVSSGETYSVAITSIDGATTDRMGDWDLKIAELSGRDPAVVAAFNHASSTSAQEQIEKVKAEVNQGEEWTFDSKGQVTFRTTAEALTRSSSPTSSPMSRPG